MKSSKKEKHLVKWMLIGLAVCVILLISTLFIANIIYVPDSSGKINITSPFLVGLLVLSFLGGCIFLLASCLAFVRHLFLSLYYYSFYDFSYKSSHETPDRDGTEDWELLENPAQNSTSQEGLGCELTRIDKSPDSPVHTDKLNILQSFITDLILIAIQKENCKFETQSQPPANSIVCNSQSQINCNISEPSDTPESFEHLPNLQDLARKKAIWENGGRKKLHAWRMANCPQYAAKFHNWQPANSSQYTINFYDTRSIEKLILVLTQIIAQKEERRKESHRQFVYPANSSPYPFNIDTVSGIDFEDFCVKLLLKSGFDDAHKTKGSGDQGVDILATKDGVRFAIQCKHYTTSNVGNAAVQEVIAGKQFYKCHVGVVMTNSHFTQAAVELAAVTGILLWDRARIEVMINKAIPFDTPLSILPLVE